jgi:DNA-binding NarL/FixJ family response regulator
MKDLDPFQSGNALRKKRILIVDDSDFIRDRLVDLLNEADNIDLILQAKDSVQAYNAFDTSSPDIVVLDIRVPGDNGIKILEKLKKTKPWVIIIMLTNYPYEQYRNKCMELGADYFFGKSDDMNKILNICNKLELA